MTNAANNTELNNVTAAAEGQEAAVAAATEVKASKAKAKGKQKKADTTAQAAAANNVTTAQVAGEAAAAKSAEPAAPSKKQIAGGLFTAMKAEGKARKDIMAAMKTATGMSDACASTYYQNFKSGAWAA